MKYGAYATQNGCLEEGQIFEKVSDAIAYADVMKEKGYETDVRVLAFNEKE